MWVLHVLTARSVFTTSTKAIYFLQATPLTKLPTHVQDFNGNLKIINNLLHVIVMELSDGLEWVKKYQ
jgi:hypothetical protein